MTTKKRGKLNLIEIENIPGGGSSNVNGGAAPDGGLGRGQQRGRPGPPTAAPSSDACCGVTVVQLIVPFKERAREQMPG